MSQPTILDYLHQLQRKGTTHVEISDPARQVLRELYTRGSARKAKPTLPPAAVAQASSPPEPTSPTPLIQGTDAATKLTSLQNQLANNPDLKALGTLRDDLVFSTGDPNANIMFVGEAPGYHEERQKAPFVGPAGQKLSQILKAMGLTRDEIYLTNVCKYRPAMKNQTTNNRRPSVDEVAASLPFLKAEAEIVKPLVIVALGGSAAEALLAVKKPVSQLREAWHQFQGIPLRVTYHPSYLLRKEEDLGEKRKLWEDMLAVLEKLNLPISEKQRSFFK